MLRAVVADLHVGQHAGDLERFAGLLSRLETERPGEVVFLGDLFRTLVGFPSFWDDTVRAGLQGLERLRAAGIRVVLIEGNRDFFLDAPALRPYYDRTGMAHSFAAGGRRFLVEHGDLVNRRDRSYLLWRAFSKSRASRAAFRLLPLRLAQTIMRRAEAKLAQTNFSYRKELPIEDLEQAAMHHFRSGVDVILWGHFHREWEFRLGEREARTVPAWAETDAVLWVSPRGELSLERPSGS